MTFEVVLAHCMDWSNYNNPIYKIFIRLTGLAVPVFMIMSFYFSYGLFLNNDNDSLKKRLRKLLIPQIGWSIIYWLSYKIIDLIFNKKLENGISSMVWQMITGNCPYLNPTMWFQTVLVF